MTLRHDRVRARTTADVVRVIDHRTERNLAPLAESDEAAISDRLGALDREWDTDRAIEIEAVATGLAGLALGAFVRPAFLALPIAAGGALLVHAFHGFHPLLPLLRRRGVRSPREIERERYALKALRGDFEGMTAASLGVQAASDARLAKVRSPEAAT